MEGRCIAWPPRQPCPLCVGLASVPVARRPEPSEIILTAGSLYRGKTRLFHRSFQPRHTSTPNHFTQTLAVLNPNPPSLLLLPPSFLLFLFPSSSSLPPFLPSSLSPSLPLPLSSPGEPSADKEALEEAAPDVELSTKKPAVVPLPDDMTAMHIDCGAFHTGKAQTHVSFKRCQTAVCSLPLSFTWLLEPNSTQIYSFCSFVSHSFCFLF